ncbi:hypothetical protein B842_03270 [Corynebacterium humireducens NBRC 106098 = DSM 45392]|uniref:DUF7172 domain-containing protein n=1 Tax=Corynebacterium humireducens NBRC 106098 = DSM 45392 TaxID=1223515 RepID=A0A0B5D5Y1_9CORY|nr:hypothetical protein [Corynebacterium humireducens]AJE32507.1 hypothetical protein B842_03270 [Corynebacterium humireducens NBRC 106098 = DSM 45392]
MTQPTQFTTSQFTTNGGVLGLDRSAMSRVVARSTVQSTGDGNHGAHAAASVVPEESSNSPALKTMIDQRVHWKNDYGVPVVVQTQIQRARRTMYLSAPNFAFIRERYTHRVGVDQLTNVLAPEPDPTSVWNTEWGGGIDIGVEGREGGGVSPRYGQYRASMPESSLMLEPVRVGVGESIDVRFRAALITPYRWWNRDGYANPDHYVARTEAFSNTLLLWAYPEAV